MNHINYARWIPIHLKDMAELRERHLKYVNITINLVLRS